MDRRRWARWVPNLTWPCPTCQAGQLRLAKETLQEIASRGERLEQDDPSANHDESLLRFVALLKCDNRACRESATIAGNHHSLWIRDSSEGGYMDENYEALSIIPSPLPFKIPQSVPRPVERVIREAGALFWFDQKAAANRSREAIEEILTDLGVPITGVKGRRLVLHTRIEQFAALDGGKWAEQATLIEGAKWIGNEGTHGDVDRETVLDAFEMLETVVEDIYVKGRHAVVEKARSMIAKHRPVRG